METALWRNHKQIKIAPSHNHFSCCKAKQIKIFLMAKINKQSTHYWSRLYGECALMSCSTSQLWWCLCSWRKSSAVHFTAPLLEVWMLNRDPLTLLLHMQKKTCGFGFAHKASGDQVVVNSAFWLIVLLPPQRKRSWKNGYAFQMGFLEAADIRNWFEVTEAFSLEINPLFPKVRVNLEWKVELKRDTSK